jgi:uncharacterized membrane protein YvbJ
MGGLGARAVLLKDQKDTKPCKRCGLHYAPDENEQCPHCAALDHAGLKKLLEQIEQQTEGNRKLGRRFLIGMLVVGLIMLIVANT